MKTRGWIDFYLPRRISYHLKIILASILIGIFFNLIWTGAAFNENLLFMLVLLFLQLEIFMAIALKIFSSGSIKTGKTYQKEIIKKLIKFYLIVLIIAFLFTFFTIMLSNLFGDQSFTDVLNNFLKYEFKGIIISWIIGGSIGSIIFFYTEWNSALKREQKLREEKLIFQYETLKNQVNPHFRRLLEKYLATVF